MIAEKPASQAASLEQVNLSVSSMDRMTQQNAAMVEESTAAGRSLANEADELGRLVQQFRTGRSGQELNARAPIRLNAGSARRPVQIPAFEGNLALKEKVDEQDWSEF